MEIIIKPFSAEYAEQCADLEQYLWKEDKKDREIRFKWTYLDCPNFHQPLCIIAVNENDEVLGFRGYFLNRFVINDLETTIAQLSDTVVSEKARRMGIFQKMTNFSLQYLKDNGVAMILNLSPSWPPYHGYKKMGFEDLAAFHSKYRFDVCQMLYKYVLKTDRSSWDKKGIACLEKANRKYVLSHSIDDSVLEQVGNFESTDSNYASLSLENIKWRTQRPGRNYIYVYSLDDDNRLHSFVMLKTNDYFNYEIGLMLTDNLSELKTLMNFFKKEYHPAVLAVWDFAMDENKRKMVKKLGMFPIPFINKIRKNPPALLRTLQTNEDGSLNWIINGKDIRNVSNWSINKLDLDSF